MKIIDIRHHLIHPGAGKNLCFVRIDTDEGIHGWGECYTQADRDVQITAHIDMLKRYLIGRDPTNIKHFMHPPLLRPNCVQWISIPYHPRFPKYENEIPILSVQSRTERLR